MAADLGATDLGATDLGAADLGAAVVPTRFAPGYDSRFCWRVLAVTGGAIVVAVAAAPAAGAPPGLLFAWLLFVGSSGHVAATLALFSFAEVRAHARRHRARYLWLPLGLLATTTLLLQTGATAPILMAFFCWQLWHYQKQNLGLAALAASSTRQPPLTQTERRCVLASGVGGVVAVLAHPGVLQVVDWRPPFPVAAALHVVAICVIGLSIGAAAVKTGRRWAPPAVPALAVFMVAVAFPLPLVMTRSPYAAIGGLTLAHGLQYLLLVGQVVRGPGGDRGRAGSGTRLVAIAAVVVSAAGLLAVASHLHDRSEPVARVLFGGYLAVVMTHFVVDAGLWRLRDAFPRRWLTDRLPQLLGGRTG